MKYDNRLSLSLRAPSYRSQLLNDNKLNNRNATAVRPWRCFQSKRNPFISQERAFDHQNRPQIDCATDFLAIFGDFFQRTKTFTY